MIKFHFPIEPVPKARPRITRSGHVYTPKKTKDFEETIKHLAILQMHSSDHGLLEGALSVKGFFFVKKPKKPKCELPIGRPDIDNLIKAIFDSLNGVVWIDDSQICHCAFEKRYSERPSITIFVESFK